MRYIIFLILLFSAVPAVAIHSGGPGWFDWLPPVPFAVAGCRGFTAGPWSIVELADSPEEPRQPWATTTLFLDCAGETVEGSFPVDSITGDIGGDGWLASRGFVFRALGTSQRAVYPVVNDKLPIYGTLYIPGSYGVNYGPTVIAYQSAHPAGIINCETRPIRFGDPNPITYMGVEGTKGHLGTPTVTFDSQMEIVLDDGSRVGPLRVASDSGRAHFILENQTVAVATWTGSLVTGAPAPDPASVVAVFDLQKSPNQWVLTTAGLWQTYAGYGDSCISGDGGSWASNKQGSKDQLVKGGVSLGGGMFSSDQSQYMADLGLSRVTTPQILLRVRGSLLGIDTAGAKPVVLSAAQHGDIRAGESGLIDYAVRNDAKLEGGASVSLLCGGVPQGVEQRVTLPVGSSSLSFPVAFAQEGPRSCELRACALATTRSCSARTLSVSVSAVRICEPGTARQDGLSVFQCAPDGRSIQMILSCPGTVTAQLAPDPNRRTSDSITVFSTPVHSGGVWSCSGVESLPTGQVCEATRTTATAQAEIGGCRVVCDIGGLPLAVTVGITASKLEKGVWRAVDCAPAVQPIPGVPVPPALLPVPKVAPAAAGPVPTPAPRQPGFEAALAIGVLAVVFLVAGRRRDGG